MNIKIEKGIPIPSQQKQVYPFHEMEVGDSFEFTLEGKSLKYIASYLNCAVHTFRRSDRNISDSKFLCRSFKERNSVRCWRIK